MGRDSQAETTLEETHGETCGRSPWGDPRGDLKKPLSHPTVTSFPSHRHPFPAPRTQKDGRQVKGEPGAGHVPAGKWPLARSNQSHLY